MPNASDLRILVLSAAVPQTWYAGSLLLYRLLQHHSPERLKAVGPSPQPKSQVLACEYSELKPAASSRLDLTRLAKLKRSLEAIALVGRIPDAAVDAAVGDFKADVVVTVTERFDYVDAAHRYCRRHGLPLALIIHDRLESFEPVYSPFAAARHQRIAAIYRDAAVRFCISPEMEQCFVGLYGAPGTVLYPNRSDALMPRASELSNALRRGSKLTVAYTGAESYGYGQRIRELMPELSSVIDLRIYSRDAWPSLPPGAVHAGMFLPDELWERVKGECDAVWLPYSHDEAMRSLYETHFPSKLTEYVALGMPVVISGPSYATGVQWGLRHPDAVITIADDTPSQSRQAFERLTSDAQVRTRLATRVTIASDDDFNPERIRRTFLDGLQSAALRA